MFYYKDITLFQNKNRVEKIKYFRELIIFYFEREGYELENQEHFESLNEQALRTEINQKSNEVHQILTASDLRPIMNWTPPPMIGGYRQNIDLILNIFNLGRFSISINHLIDFIDRSIGIYEADFLNSKIRTFNPFFYLNLVFRYISQAPFKILGEVGFNKNKIEESIFGRVIKLFLYLIVVFASFLTILEILDLVDWFKGQILGA